MFGFAKLRRAIIRGLQPYGIDLRAARQSRRGRAAYLVNRDAYFARAGDEFPRGADWPCWRDRFEAGGVAGGQYFHQDLLVAQWISAAGPRRHVDVGSRIDGFVAHVASFREIDVLDLRPVRSSASGSAFISTTSPLTILPGNQPPTRCRAFTPSSTSALAGTATTWTPMRGVPGGPTW